MLTNDIDTLCKYGNGIGGHLTNTNNHFCKSISSFLLKEILNIPFLNTTIFFMEI